MNSSPLDLSRNLHESTIAYGYLWIQVLLRRYLTPQIIPQSYFRSYSWIHGVHFRLNCQAQLTFEFHLALSQNHDIQLNK